MGNLNLISVLKQTILSAILSDADIMKLVTNSGTVTVPAMSARYDQVFPWKRVPKTIDEATTLITFEVAIPGTLNCAVRDFILRIYVMTHESLMKVDQGVANSLGISDKGVRIDILADKIDYLLNGSEDFGFKKLELEQSNPFDPVDGYHGRTLEYSAQGFNRYGEKL